MKKLRFFYPIFILMAVFLFPVLGNSVTETSSPLTSVRGNACIIKDHIVYELIEREYPQKAYYNVCAFFDSQEAFETTREIRIASEIDGTPVRKIETQYKYEFGGEFEYRALFPLSQDISTEKAKVYDLGENTTLKRIVLPNGIKKIGVATFRNLKALEEIRLPQSLVSIGNDAFSNCIALQKIDLPSSLKKLGGGSFAGTGLTELELPAGIKAIPANLCADCIALKKVSLSNRTESIGLYAFFNTNLTSIQLPDSLKAINGYAFKNTALKSIKIPENCELYAGVFRDCKNLKKVVFAKRSGLILLRSDLFYSCSNLKKIKMYSNTSLEIAATTLRKCTSLQSFTIPRYAKMLNGPVFADCIQLKKLRILPTNTELLTNNGLFLQTIPDTCRIYVKTAAMKRAVVGAGFTGKVIVKADLK